VSIVAEFAAELQGKYQDRLERDIVPMGYPSRNETLSDIRVVIFDVYGTLFNYWRPEFVNETDRRDALLAAFGKTIRYFGMGNQLLEMNPQEQPEKTLSDLYHGLITLKHDLALDKKVDFPEVRIEEIWETIYLMVKRRGYAPSAMNLGGEADFIKCLAYCYNFFSFNRRLYPGVVETLKALKQGNILLGILSNAQFYTPIDLTLLLRGQSNDDSDDYLRLFEQDLVFFSYEYGVSKPNMLMFRKLFDALYEFNVLPAQTLFVGNDLAQDIKPAQDAGMKTAFFTGDSQCVFVHDLGGAVVPDISFSAWEELPQRVSFHGPQAASVEKGFDDDASL
jgi:putative hydrolase of the HAD superfamily